MADAPPRRPGATRLPEDELVAFLATTPAFGDQDPARLRELASMLDDAVIPAGHLMLAPGQDDLLLLLAEGTAEVVAPAGATRLIGPGALLGSAPGTDGDGEVRARTCVVVYVVRRRRLVRWLGSGPE